jgi:hypothetical protein
MKTLMRKKIQRRKNNKSNIIRKEKCKPNWEIRIKALRWKLKQFINGRNISNVTQN